MYTRPTSGRFPRGMRIPDNYGGSAFSTVVAEETKPDDDKVSPVSETPADSPQDVTPTKDETNAEIQESSPAAPVGFRLGFGKLFSHSPLRGGIGTEELLLLGLILLISQEPGNNDLIMLLIFLLLIQ